MILAQKNPLDTKKPAEMAWLDFWFNHLIPLAIQGPRAALFLLTILILTTFTPIFLTSLIKLWELQDQHYRN